MPETTKQKAKRELAERILTWSTEAREKGLSYSETIDQIENLLTASGHKATAIYTVVISILLAYGMGIVTGVWMAAKFGG